MEEDEVETSQWFEIATNSIENAMDITLVNSQKRVSSYKKNRKLFLLFQFKEHFPSTSTLEPVASYVEIDHRKTILRIGEQCRLKLIPDTGFQSEKLFEISEPKSTIELFGKVNNRHKCAILVEVPSLSFRTLVPYSSIPTMSPVKRKLQLDTTNYEITDVIPDSTVGNFNKQKICIQWNKEIETINNVQVTFELGPDSKPVEAEVEKATKLYANVYAPSISEFNLDYRNESRIWIAIISVTIDGIHLGKTKYSYVNSMEESGDFLTGIIENELP